MADQNMSHENDRKLDEMLDAMLSAYSAAEPRPGLETRILANVTEHSAKRERLWNLRWIWGGVAAAAAVILLMAYYLRPQPRATVPQIATRPQQQVAPAVREKTSARTSTAASHSSRQHRTRMGKLPPAADHVIVVKQDVFPSRSPLSEQEKLLLRYLARTPREELVAQSRPDPPEDEEENDVRNSRPENLTQVLQHSSNTR
jgi:hypothetical protein